MWIRLTGDGAERCGEAQRPAGWGRGGELVNGVEAERSREALHAIEGRQCGGSRHVW